MTVDISHIIDFLPCQTPQAWIDEACKPNNLPVILTDHANNELKAAQSAMSIMSRYRSERSWSATCKSELDELQRDIQLSLLNKMSRLAREELRHYEQVLSIMSRRGIAYNYLGAGRYAGQMGKEIRTFEPEKLIDTLIMGAFIEARSCERFSILAPHLDEELQKFYLSLLKSESRHFQDYLTLAGSISECSVDDRVSRFAELEQWSIQSPDPIFRFHSGIPD